MEQFDESAELPEFDLFDTLPEIPAQCKDCPYLRGAERELIRHKMAIDYISKRAMSDELSGDVDRFREVFPAFEADTPTEEVTQRLRQYGSDQIEQISQHVEGIEEDIALLTQECAGVLKARIKSRADHSVYVQRICRTPMTLIGKEIIRPVWQTRERLEE